MVGKEAVPTVGLPPAACELVSLTWPPHVHKADMPRCTGGICATRPDDVISTNIRVACTTENALSFYLEVIARHAAV